jgi:hypothetical protein
LILRPLAQNGPPGQLFLPAFANHTIGKYSP